MVAAVIDKGPAGVSAVRDWLGDAEAWMLSKAVVPGGSVRPSAIGSEDAGLTV